VWETLSLFAHLFVFPEEPFICVHLLHATLLNFQMSTVWCCVMHEGSKTSDFRAAILFSLDGELDKHAFN